MSMVERASNVIHTHDMETVKVFLLNEGYSDGYSVQILLIDADENICDDIPIYQSRYNEHEYDCAMVDFWKIVRDLASCDPVPTKNREGEIIRILRENGYDARCYTKNDYGEIMKIIVHGANGRRNIFTTRYIEGDSDIGARLVMKYCEDVDIRPYSKKLA